jgi:hypothetical protein
MDAATLGKASSRSRSSGHGRSDAGRRRQDSLSGEPAERMALGAFFLAALAVS